MIYSKTFASALRRLGSPTDGQRSFLEAHERAAARTSTATLLAEAAGYENYNGINLQYGILAANLAREIGLPEDSGLSLLVDFIEPKVVTNDHWLLVMRPEFAQALKDAGWIS